MSAMNLDHPHRAPVWVRLPVWVAVFLSPSAFILLVIIMDRLQMPAPTEGVAVALFCLIPIVALLVCGSLVWRSNKSFGWRVSGLVFTTLAMLLQCGIWVVIIATAVSAAIAPAQ